MKFQQGITLSAENLGTTSKRTSGDKVKSELILSGEIQPPVVVTSLNETYELTVESFITWVTV